MKFRFNRTIFALILATFFTASGASAGDAVSSVTGKAELLSGNVNGAAIGTSALSVAFPLWNNLGMQVNAMAGGLDHDQIHGAGANLFFRKPETGMLGISSSYAKNDELDVKRVGFEGELFIKRVTLTNYIGVQSGDVEEKGSFDKDAGYILASLSCYPTDNLKLSAGASSSDGENRVFTEVEYLTPVNGLALYVDTANGSNDYDYVAGGMRIYFDSGKTLIQRHREDTTAVSLQNSVTELIR